MKGNFSGERALFGLKNEKIEDYSVFIRTEEDEEEKREVLRYVQEHNLFFDSDTKSEKARFFSIILKNTLFHITS